MPKHFRDNTSVREICLNVSGENWSWDAILDEISKHETLKRISIVHGPFGTKSPAEIIQRVIQAVQKNSWITDVVIGDITVSGRSVASVLDEARGLEFLALQECIVADREAGAEAIAASLQRNTNLRILDLYGLSTVIVQPILHTLSSACHLKELQVGGYDDMPPPTLLGQVLEATTSIESFMLRKLLLIKGLFLQLQKASPTI